MLKRLWLDEGGGLISAELILLMTLILGGAAVGLNALRVAIVTELADVGALVGALNQSFSGGGITGQHSSSSPQAFTDLLDTSDDGCTQVGDASRCVSVCLAGDHQEGPQPAGGT